MEALWLVVLGACVGWSSACSCFLAHSPDRYCGYPIIFRGMAVAEYEERRIPIDHSDPFWEFYQFRDWVYTMRIDETIQMPEHLNGSERLSVRTAMQGSLCGIRFPLDVEAVFFAKVNQDGEITTGLCAPNVPWADLSDHEQQLLTNGIVGYCQAKEATTTTPVPEIITPPVSEIPSPPAP